MRLVLRRMTMYRRPGVMPRNQFQPLLKSNLRNELPQPPQPQPRPPRPQPQRQMVRKVQMQRQGPMFQKRPAPKPVPKQAPIAKRNPGWKRTTPPKPVPLKPQPVPRPVPKPPKEVPGQRYKLMPPELLRKMELLRKRLQLQKNVQNNQKKTPVRPVPRRFQPIGGSWAARGLIPIGPGKFIDVRTHKVITLPIKKQPMPIHPPWERYLPPYEKRPPIHILPAPRPPEQFIPIKTPIRGTLPIKREPVYRILPIWVPPQAL